MKRSTCEVRVRGCRWREFERGTYCILDYMFKSEYSGSGEEGTKYVLAFLCLLLVDVPKGRFLFKETIVEPGVLDQFVVPIDVVVSLYIAEMQLEKQEGKK